jgi:hypothetical protein
MSQESKNGNNEEISSSILSISEYDTSVQSDARNNELNLQSVLEYDNITNEEKYNASLYSYRDLFDMSVKLDTYAQELFGRFPDWEDAQTHDMVHMHHPELEKLENNYIHISHQIVVRNMSVEKRALIFGVLQKCVATEANFRNQIENLIDDDDFAQDQLNLRKEMLEEINKELLNHFQHVENFGELNEIVAGNSEN